MEQAAATSTRRLLASWIGRVAAAAGPPLFKAAQIVVLAWIALELHGLRDLSVPDYSQQLAAISRDLHSLQTSAALSSPSDYTGALREISRMISLLVRP
jgi:hypothetical protein